MSEFDAKAARAKRPLPLWVDAFQRDTALLETDEVGAYLKLLMAMWSARAVALPNDSRKLARAAGVSPRLWKSRVWPSLEGFFSSCEEGLTQKRLREEAAYVERQVTAQSNRKRDAEPESKGYAKPQVTPDASREDAENPAKTLKDNDPPQSVDDTTDTPTAHPSQQPNNPTLEDGGGGYACAGEADDPPTFRERLLSACGVDPTSGLTGHGGSQLGTPPQMVEANRWRDDLGLSEEQVVAEVQRVMSQKRDGPPKSLAYFRSSLERLAGQFAEARTVELRPAASQTGAMDQPAPASEPRAGIGRFRIVPNIPKEYQDES